MSRVHYYYYYYSAQFNSTPTKTRMMPGERRQQVPFSMVKAKVELMHVCFPKHLNM